MGGVERGFAELFGVHFTKTLEAGDLEALLARRADRRQEAAEVVQPGHRLAAAEAALGSLESKYAALPWLVGNQRSVDAARKAARAGIQESEAEKLFAEAADLFSQKELFDLKPIVDRLKADYAATRAVADAQRKPPFAELEKAVANLGKRMIVRQDGKGDFKSIQAAVEAAPPNSLIEIQDNGPYNEQVAIGKEGLTLRGKRGCWPIITSSGPLTNFSVLVNVSAPGVVLERLVLLHGGAAGQPQCVLGKASLRSCIAWGAGQCAIQNGEVQNSLTFCLVPDPSRVSNSICFDLRLPEYATAENVLMNGLSSLSKVQLARCTSLSTIAVGGPSVRVTDCIVPSVQYWRPDAVIEHCNVHGNPPYIDQAKPGKDCFGGDPQFVDPQNLDYRLRPTSPCRGRASDGGDVGCRYTPEMIELCNVALQLRRKGIIKF